MKILTHFMQTIFGKSQDKIRVQWVFDKSGIRITALVGNNENDNTQCDLEKVQAMAQTLSLPRYEIRATGVEGSPAVEKFSGEKAALEEKPPYIVATIGDFSYATIYLSAERIRQLTQNHKLFYGYTAIVKDLNSNAAFLDNSETNGVSIDLNLVFSDFEMFQMMHEVLLTRKTLTSGLLSTLGSNMVPLLRTLLAEKTNDRESMERIMKFVKENPTSRSATIFSQYRNLFSDVLKAEIDVMMPTPPKPETNSAMQPAVPEAGGWNFLGLRF